MNRSGSSLTIILFTNSDLLQPKRWSERSGANTVLHADTLLGTKSSAEASTQPPPSPHPLRSGARLSSSRGDADTGPEVEWTLHNKTTHRGALKSLKRPQYFIYFALKVHVGYADWELLLLPASIQKIIFSRGLSHSKAMISIVLLTTLTCSSTWLLNSIISPFE